MPVAIKLRTAQPSDGVAIAAVYLASWRAGYRDLLPDSVLDEQARLRADRDWLAPIESSSSAVVLAVDDETIVGVIQADDGHLGDGDRDLPEITMLYVVPSSWGSPAARQLLAAGLSWIEKRGHGAARLRVVETQRRARRFYEREGWTLDDLPPDTNGLMKLIYYRRDLVDMPTSA